MEESGKAAERMNQRRQNNKKKLRRERPGDYHEPPTSVYSEDCTVFRGNLVLPTPYWAESSCWLQGGKPKVKRPRCKEPERSARR